ncbi:hypothetical protein HWV62_41028 [Athelia sp. TMB]|nr:hypothetical protein HWV62_41028 [Athelia sp. TMB]
MPHPLHVPDIILSILDQLEPSSTESAEKTNRSLANIAVVCRSWLEPALDRLWKRQYELLPLLKTLPSHKWNIDRYHSFTIVGALNSRDWNRWDYYASRMRHLSILPRNFTQDLYSILHSRSQSGPLFRHLTSLEWRSYSLAQPNLFSTIVPFINNSLKHLLIIFPYSEDGNEGHEAAQLLSTLPTQTPALKLLSVKGSSHVANAAFEAVCSLSHLETLYTEDFGIPQVYLVPLARLNNLRRLSLTLNKYTHLTNPAAVVPAFHSLEAIYLDTTEPFYATLFILKFLTGAPLREFTLKFPHFLHPDAAMHLASAMTALQRAPAILYIC